MSQGSVKDTTGYVNYVYNISARGTTQVASQLLGLSGITSNILGQLAFQTSSYLSSTEGALLSMGVVATTGFAKATKQAAEFDQALATIGAISGKTTGQVSGLGEQAMDMSSKFGIAVGEMTKGLESLARAGVSTANMNAILEQAMGLSKLEGLSLEAAINDLISTTNLLDTTGLDLESPEYAEAVKRQNQRITATSEAAPINAQDIIHTLEHVGGYASSTNLDQDDLFAVIAQLGSKGTKSEMAGTSLRAFLAAGQKDTAQRALKRIGLDVSDLWKDDDTIMSISDMKDVLDEAMEAKGYTQQEKLEFYSDFAGYKQANQIMKIDTNSVREFKEKIDHSWDMSKKIQQVIGTAETNIQGLIQAGTNLLTKVGEPLLPIISIVAGTTKTIIEIVNKIPGSNFILAGTLVLASIKGISTIFNKIAPQLLAARSNVFDVKEMFHSLRKDLGESFQILKNINDMGWLKNQSAWISSQNITNEDKVLYWKENSDFNVRDINDVYYLENNQDYKKKYIEWKYNRTVQGQKEEAEREERNQRSSSKNPPTGASETPKKVNLNKVEEYLNNIGKTLIEIKEILPNRTISDKSKKEIFLNKDLKIDGSIIKDLKNHTFRVIVMNKPNEIVPVHDLGSLAYEKSLRTRSRISDPKDRGGTNVNNMKNNEVYYAGGTVYIPNQTFTSNSRNKRSGSSKNTKFRNDSIGGVNFDKIKKTPIFTKKGKGSRKDGYIEELSTFELGEKDIENFLNSIEIDFGFATDTSEGRQAQNMMSRIFYDYIESNIDTGHINLQGLGDKELKDKILKEFKKEGNMPHFMTNFKTGRVSKAFFQQMKDIKLYTEKDLESMLVPPRFLRTKETAKTLENYDKNVKKNTLFMDILRSGKNPFTEKVKYNRDFANDIKDQNGNVIKEQYKKTIEDFTIGKSDFKVTVKDMDIIDTVLRKFYGKEVELETLKDLKGLDKKKAVYRNFNKVFSLNKGKLSEGFYQELTKELDQSLNKESTNAHLLDKIALEYDDITKKELKTLAYIMDVDITPEQIKGKKSKTISKADIAKRIVRSVQSNNGVMNSIVKYTDRRGIEQQVNPIRLMQRLSTDKLAYFVTHSSQSAFNKFRKEMGLSNTNKERAMIEYWMKTGGESRQKDLDRIKILDNIIEANEMKLHIGTTDSFYSPHLTKGQNVISSPNKDTERVLQLIGEEGWDKFAKHAKKIGDAAFEMAIDEALPYIERALYEEIIQLSDEEQEKYLTPNKKRVQDWVIFKQIKNLHIPHRRKHHPHQLMSSRYNDDDLKETIMRATTTLHDSSRGNEETQTATHGKGRTTIAKALFVAEPDKEHHWGKSRAEMKAEGVTLPIGDGYIVDENGVAYFTGRHDYLGDEEEKLRKLNYNQFWKMTNTEEDYSGSKPQRRAKREGISASFNHSLFSKYPHLFGRFANNVNKIQIPMMRRYEATKGRNYLTTAVYKRGNKFIATESPRKTDEFVGFTQNLHGDVREGLNWALERRRNKIYTQNRHTELFGSLALKYGLSRGEIMNMKLTSHQEDRIKKMYEAQEFVDIEDYIKKNGGFEFEKIRGQMKLSNKFRETDKGLEKVGNIFNSWVTEAELKKLRDNKLIDITEGNEGVLDERTNKKTGEKEFKITNYDALHYSKDDYQSMVMLQDINKVKELREFYNSLNIAKRLKYIPNEDDDEEIIKKIEKENYEIYESFVKDLIKKDDNEIKNTMLALSLYNPELVNIVKDVTKQKIEKTKHYLDKRGQKEEKEKIKQAGITLNKTLESMYGSAVAEFASPEILEQMGIDSFDQLDAYVYTLVSNGRILRQDLNNISEEERKRLYQDYEDEMEAFENSADYYNEEFAGADSSLQDTSRVTIGDVVYDNLREEALKGATYDSDDVLADSLDPALQRMLKLESLLNIVTEDELENYSTVLKNISGIEVMHNRVRKQLEKNNEEVVEFQNDLLNLAMNIQQSQENKSELKETVLSNEEEKIRKQNLANTDVLLLDTDTTTPEVRGYTKAQEFKKQIESFFYNTSSYIYDKVGGRNNSDVIKTVSGINKTLHDTTGKLTTFKDFLAGASNVFPPLIAAVVTLETVISALTKAEEVFAGIQGFLNIENAFKASEDGIIKIFGKDVKEKSTTGRLLMSISSVLGNALSKLTIFIRNFLGPIMLVTSALVATKLALDWSYQSHKKYLKQLQEEEKANKSKSKSLQAINEQNKKAFESNRNGRQDINLYRRYRLSKQRLDNANLIRSTGAVKLTNAETDALWGKYGIASALDKIQGKYKSTAEEYSGSSSQIRKIKEHTTGGQPLLRGMPGYYSQAEELVAAYYDANKLAIGVMDEYKDELGQLYDEETNAMKRTHYQGNARETRQFQMALDRFVEATGITRDHAQQYLDYMQTEHNIENATQAMQAQADSIMANADFKIQAISFGGNPSDVLGLNGIEAQQNAMVQAQADMIQLEASSQLWWKAVWATIASPINIIKAPIFAIAHTLAAIWSVITGNWNSADIHMRQAGASLNVFGEATTYWGAWGELESTNFNKIGQGAIDETDRANYGNASASSGAGPAHVRRPQENSIFGFLPVWWPNKPGGMHGKNSHAKTVAQNAQQSFFSKLIGGVTAALGTITTILVAGIIGSAALSLFRHIGGIDTLKKYAEKYFPGIMKKIDKIPGIGVAKSVYNAVEGFDGFLYKFLGLDEVTNFVKDQIPQEWKDTASKYWGIFKSLYGNTKGRVFKDDETKAKEAEKKEKDQLIGVNVSDIKDNVSNIWGFIQQYGYQNARDFIGGLGGGGNASVNASSSSSTWVYGSFKHCPRCGAINPKNEQFCKRCGIRLDDGPEPIFKDKGEERVQYAKEKSGFSKDPDSWSPKTQEEKEDFLDELFNLDLITMSPASIPDHLKGNLGWTNSIMSYVKFAPGEILNADYMIEGMGGAENLLIQTYFHEMAHNSLQHDQASRPFLNYLDDHDRVVWDNRIKEYETELTSTFVMRRLGLMSQEQLENHRINSMEDTLISQGLMEYVDFDRVHDSVEYMVENAKPLLDRLVEMTESERFAWGARFVDNLKNITESLNVPQGGDEVGGDDDGGGEVSGDNEILINISDTLGIINTNLVDGVGKINDNIDAGFRKHDNTMQAGFAVLIASNILQIPSGDRQLLNRDLIKTWGAEVWDIANKLDSGEGIEGSYNNNISANEYEDSDKPRIGIFHRLGLQHKTGNLNDTEFTLEKQRQRNNNNYLPGHSLNEKDESNFIKEIVDNFHKNRLNYGTATPHYEDLGLGNGPELFTYTDNWQEQLDLDKLLGEVLGRKGFSNYSNTWGIIGHYFNYEVNDFLRGKTDGSKTAAEMLPGKAAENWDMAHALLGIPDEIKSDTTVKEIAEIMSESLSQSTGLMDNTVLYRGGHLETDESGVGVLSAITSTSYLRGVAEEYKAQSEDNYLMRIFAPAGTQGFANPNVESEFTLAPDQEYIELHRDEEKKEATILLLTKEQAASLKGYREALKEHRELMERQEMELYGLSPLSSDINTSMSDNIDNNINASIPNNIGNEETSPQTLPILSLMGINTEKMKQSWGDYLINKRKELTHPWREYLGEQKDNLITRIAGGVDKETFNKKKRKGMNKADREYLNEKYDLGLDLDSFRTSKQANKAIRNKLDENGQWDTAIDDLYMHNTKERYVAPWKKYAKDKAEKYGTNLLTEAQLYNENPTYMGKDLYDKENASMPVKILAKGLKLKDKYLGENTGIGSFEEIQEAINDPEKMVALIKKNLDNIDDNSPLAEYRDKIYKAQELAQDPKALINHIKNSDYINNLKVGARAYLDNPTYLGEDLSGQASLQTKLMGKALSWKDKYLGEDSIEDVLTDPERVESILRGTLGDIDNGALDDLNIMDSIKSKMAGIFNKEDIKDAIEEGIDEGTDEEGGGLFGSVKNKLADLFGLGSIKQDEFSPESENPDEEISSKNNLAKFVGLHESEEGGYSTTMGKILKESTPGGFETSESILPLDEDESILPEINGENISKGGKTLSKIGNKLAGKGGKLGKLGKGMSKIGGGISKAGSKGIGGIAKGGISKLGKSGVGKAGGKLMSKVGGKIAGKVGGKIMSKVGAQVASKVLGGALMATGIGAPLGLLLESPLGGMIMEGVFNLGGKALGAVGGAVKGVGKALFGRKAIGKGGGGGLFSGLMAATPIGMIGNLIGKGSGLLKGAHGGISNMLAAANPIGMLANMFGGKGSMNQAKMIKPFNKMSDDITNIFKNDKINTKHNEAIEKATQKTANIMQERQQEQSISSEGGGNITIQNININTQDDPEAIKAMFLELIIELQEQVNPRLVSRTAGKPSNSSTISSTDTSTTEEESKTPNTDENGNIISHQGH